jgi:PhnB protein
MGEGDVNPVPEGFHTLTPSLVVDDAAAAIDFYKRAFGAEEVSRSAGPDGKTIWHAELQIGNSRLMLNDEFPDMGVRGPKKVGGTSSSLWLYVPDVDAVHQQAVEAGAEVTSPVETQFWGDRTGNVTDPFGHLWSIATRVESPTPEELERRQEAARASFGG